MLQRQCKFNVPCTATNTLCALRLGYVDSPSGAVVVFVYSSFWLVNKSEKTMYFREVWSCFCC